MTLILLALLLALLCATTFYCARRAVRAYRSQSCRRLLAETFRTSVDAVGGTGISLLCGESDLRRIEQLLAVEYPTYEVVVTLDANDDYERFAAIVRHYGMARVSHALSHELPTVGIRGLYRSQERRFRRLILIDKLSTVASDDLNAAACYASYEYLWPLADGCLPARDAVERLAVAVAECADDDGRNDIAVIRTDMGAPSALYRRDTVAACGGFGSAALRRLPQRRVRTIHEVLVWCPVRSGSMLAAGLGVEPAAESCDPTPSRRAAMWGVSGLVTALALTATIFAAHFGWLPLAAVALTAVAAWSVARYVMSLSDEQLPRLRAVQKYDDEI